MDTIFMNFEKSKTDPHRLLLNLSDKINLEKVVNMLLYQVLAYTKSDLKYHLQRGMINLN